MLSLNGKESYDQITVSAMRAEGGGNYISCKKYIPLHQQLRIQIFNI